MAGAVMAAFTLDGMTLWAEVLAMAEQIDRVCAAILRANSILMVNIDYGERAVWTLPGGEIEAGETDAQALVREVAKEVRVRGRVGRRLYTSVTNSPGHEVRETCYLVEIDADQIPTSGYNPGFETQRFVAVAWIPLERLGEDIQVSNRG